MKTQVSLKSLVLLIAAMALLAPLKGYGQSVHVSSSIDFGTVAKASISSQPDPSAGYYQVIDILNQSDGIVDLLYVEITNVNGPNMIYVFVGQTPQYSDLTMKFTPEIPIGSGQTFHAGIMLSAKHVGNTSGVARALWRNAGGSLDSADIALHSNVVDSTGIFFLGPSNGSVVSCPCDPTLTLNSFVEHWAILNTTGNNLIVDSVGFTGDTAEIQVNLLQTGFLWLDGGNSTLPLTIGAGDYASTYVQFQPTSTGTKVLQVMLYCEDETGKPIVLLKNVSIDDIPLSRGWWMLPEEDIQFGTTEVGKCTETDSSRSLANFYYCGSIGNCADTAVMTLNVISEHGLYFHFVAPPATFKMYPGSSVFFDLRFCPTFPVFDTTHPFDYAYDTLLLTVLSPAYPANHIFFRLESYAPGPNAVRERSNPNSFSLAAHPNPFREQVTFDVSAFPNIERCVISDVLGRVVWENIANDPQHSVQWRPLATTPNGIYTATVMGRSTGTLAPAISMKTICLER